MKCMFEASKRSRFVFDSAIFVLMWLGVWGHCVGCWVSMAVGILGYCGLLVCWVCVVGRRLG